MKSAPTVSVIIPTHNRSTSLRRTLEALRRQTYSPELIETVVVADGCRDDTIEMLRTYEAPFAIHVVELPGRGAATARNHGAARAKGELLIFIDDDIEPVASFVEAHVRTHGEHYDQVVIGYSRPVIPRNPNFYWMELRGWWEAMFGRMRESGHRYTFHDLLSGNFSLRAKLFHRVGGFDTAFPNCGGEDFELGVRLIRAGATLTFANEAVGDHHETRDLAGLLRRKHQEGRADVLIVKRHPELLPAFPLARFEHPFHRLNRLLRRFAFENVKTGDRISYALRRQLDFYEGMRLRSRWRQTLDVLLDYWYWRGVAEELKSRAALAALLQHDGVQEQERDNLYLEIDVSEGLEAAEQHLDEQRPASLRVYHGKRLIGEVAAKPGAEPLRGAHLRPLLAKSMAWTLSEALASEQRIGGSTDLPESTTHKSVDSLSKTDFQSA